MKQITVLIADDEPDIAELIALYLQREGYATIVAANGTEAVNAIRTHAVDLAILDVMMPETDGHEALRLVRERTTLPIIFVSARSSDLDKITGLVLGADDYMAKPFNPLELVARVNAQLRRAHKLNRPPAPAGEPVIEAGGLVIDKPRRTVHRYGSRVELTPKEFDILHLLAAHPGHVFGTEHIFRSVWEEAYYDGGCGNTVMVHIRSLRKKLGDDNKGDRLIRTVWGVGYSFDG